MKAIDPTRTDLVQEFCDAPFGPHSAELREVLQILRWSPLKGKRVLVCIRPGEEWRIGINPGKRGEAIAYEGEPHTDFGQALGALFRRRWELASGVALGS
jgi:hypothetical protein